MRADLIMNMINVFFTIALFKVCCLIVTVRTASYQLRVGAGGDGDNSRVEVHNKALSEFGPGANYSAAFAHFIKVRRP